ncbi:hypothetical protein [Mycobacterium sp. shizuoka-1]|uniref:hypothetical protein n=1 Tax=Mycobacterium sp. shizuoka-1 TaxID=2039281 RepID=UPI000C05E39D|nr:hypothetical protein [Mycobacterium sp. shizuoka-1]GAY18237.1 hypothetical protein MSZK_49630 [Mycobacterium sp. shizuoka-1]
MSVAELARWAPAADDVSSVRRRPSPTAGIALFLFCSVAYFAVGTVMILRYNYFDPDGPSRLANAGYAIMSRDPHVSAIGFVWNPLPSLTEIPLLPLSRWWPELKTQGLAAVVQSAMFMAAAVVMVRRIAMDRGLSAVWRRVAIVALAANPVIVIYGASGMSEAAEIFCTLWAARNLLRWVDSRDVGHLAWVGIAMAVGYLARYEFAFSAAATAMLVALVSLSDRAFTDRRMLWQRTALNILIVGFPIGVAFTSWAVVGWVTTGDLFATLSSTYGNAGQIATAALRGMTTDKSGNNEPLIIAMRLLAMQPVSGIAVALAVWLAAKTRRADPLVPLAVFGSVLAFAAWGQFTGTTFGWFRFYILAIPMVIVIAMCCWAPVRTIGRHGEKPATAVKAGAALLCASLLVFPVTATAMLNPDIGNQHLQFGWRSIIDPQKYPPAEQWYRRLRTDDRLIADYLDNQHLPNGSVLMDTFAGWGIWLYSDDPKQFVVTSDYDFAAALNRPWDNRVRYILVSNPALNDAPDAVNLRWPTLWADGAGFGRLVFAAVGATGQIRWRIYEVTGPPQPQS